MDTDGAIGKALGQLVECYFTLSSSGIPMAYDLHLNLLLLQSYCYILQHDYDDDFDSCSAKFQLLCHEKIAPVRRHNRLVHRCENWHKEYWGLRPKCIGRVPLQSSAGHVLIMSVPHVLEPLEQP
eukprot:1189782-Prorocentrum_minimum.AAC.5